MTQSTGGQGAHPCETDDTPLPAVATHGLFTKEYSGPGRNYSIEERMLALSVYAETGNISEAAKTTGVPKTTIHGWLNRDDSGDALVEMLRTALRFKVAHRCAEACVLAITNTIDRLRDGDEVMGKDGQIRNIRVRARDSAAIASIMADKHALLTGGLQGKKAAAGLPKLAQELEALLLKRGIQVEPGTLDGL